MADFFSVEEFTQPPLPPFQLTRPCKKCGFVGASVTYNTLIKANQRREWLERKCERCGYAWAEEVIPPPP